MVLNWPYSKTMYFLIVKIQIFESQKLQLGLQATGITSKLLKTEKLYLNRRSSIFNLIIFLRRAFEYFLKNVLFGRSPVYRVDFPTARFEILFWWWLYRGGGIREGGTSWYNAVKGVVYREPVALSPLSPPSRNKIEKNKPK